MDGQVIQVGLDHSFYFYLTIRCAMGAFILSEKIVYVQSIVFIGHDLEFLIHLFWNFHIIQVIQLTINLKGKLQRDFKNIFLLSIFYYSRLLLASKNVSLKVYINRNIYLFYFKAKI